MNPVADRAVSDDVQVLQHAAGMIGLLARVVDVFDGGPAGVDRRAMATVSATDLAPPSPRIHLPVLQGIWSGAVIR